MSGRHRRLSSADRIAAVDAPARLARPDDAAELVRLRAIMFVSMGADESETTWQARCHDHLEEELAEGA